MSVQQVLPQVIRDVWDQLILLAISGMGGAFFRAVFAPEKEWKRRIIQGLAGASSAIFLGGAVAHMIDSLVSVGVYAFLAAGFLMGSAGELGVKFLQEKLMGKSK